MTRARASDQLRLAAASGDAQAVKDALNDGADVDNHNNQVALRLTH